MGERIKELRKHLNLTQQEFAERISIKRNTLSQYEIGRSNPTDSLVDLICREFGVSETWLRSGEGEMFKGAGAEREHLREMIDELLTDSSESFRQGLLEVIVRLDLKQIEAIKEYARRYLLPTIDEPNPAAKSQHDEPNPAVKSQHDGASPLTVADELEIQRKAADYAEQLRAEKIAEAGSEASNITEDKKEA